MKLAAGPLLVAVVLAFSPLASVGGGRPGTANTASNEDSATIDLATPKATDEATQEKLDAPLVRIRSAAELASYLESREPDRSEEHTSELQSLMRISYAVFCLKKKKT